MPPLPKHRAKITPQPVGKAPLPVGAADIGAGAQAIGLQRIGASTAKLGEQLLQIKTAEDVAQGTAEYNNTINEYNLSLKDKNPEDYLETNEAGELILPKELSDRLAQIPVGKTGPAGRNLQNKFKVWNEANRASIAILAARDKSAQIRQTAPDVLSDFAQNQDDKGAEEYIKEITKLTGVQSTEELTLLYGKIKDEAEIFRAINLASDLPTPENIAEARKVIEEKSESERDKFFNLQRLRALSSTKASRRNEAFDARVEAESLGMAESFSSGLLHSRDIVPELEPVRQQFMHRVTNNSLNISDGQTSDFMIRQIDEGKLFSQAELTDAYASGLSTDEYESLVTKNKENERLTISEKGRLTIFNAHISDKHNTLLSIARPKFSANTLPTVMTVLDKDTQNLRSRIKKMVMADDKDTDIYDAIEANYTKSTESGKLRSDLWFVPNIFLPRVFELNEETRNLTGIDERFEAVNTLLKSGDRKDFERAQELLRRWYE